MIDLNGQLEPLSINVRINISSPILTIVSNEGGFLCCGVRAPKELRTSYERVAQGSLELNLNHSTGITGALPILVLVGMCRRYITAGVTAVGGPN